ncbi:MAG: hypothetical protein WDM78_04830 [Puia sp.]
MGALMDFDSVIRYKSIRWIIPSTGIFGEWIWAGIQYCPIRLSRSEQIFIMKKKSARRNFIKVASAGLGSLAFAPFVTH